MVSFLLRQCASPFQNDLRVKCFYLHSSTETWPGAISNPWEAASQRKVRGSPIFSEPSRTSETCMFEEQLKQSFKITKFKLPKQQNSYESFCDRWSQDKNQLRGEHMFPDEEEISKPSGEKGAKGYLCQKIQPFLLSQMLRRGRSWGFK